MGTLSGDSEHKPQEFPVDDFVQHSLQQKQGYSPDSGPVFTLLRCQLGSEVQQSVSLRDSGGQAFRSDVRLHLRRYLQGR